jgi:hypothetical protein
LGLWDKAAAVKAAGILRGSRFNESSRTFLILAMVYDSSIGHIEKEVARSKSATEKSSNGLVRSAVAIVNNQYTAILLLAGATVHADIIGPLDTEMTARVYVLEAGIVIRQLFDELNLIVGQPDLVLERMKHGQP